MTNVDHLEMVYDDDWHYRFAYALAQRTGPPASNLTLESRHVHAATV